MNSTIKQAIEDKAEQVFPNWSKSSSEDFSDADKCALFESAAEYGYSLAEQEMENEKFEHATTSIALDNALKEITRITELLYKEFFDRRNPYKADPKIEKEWQQFKTNNQL